MTAASSADAVDLRWKTPTCVVIDNTFQVCKPNREWDTQKVESVASPVKWVLHRSGANPVIVIRYDFSVETLTAEEYTAEVKSRLKQRGITVDSTRTVSLHGRDVALIAGTDQPSGFRYLVAVWRAGARGIHVECTAHAKDFAAFEPQFMESIESVKILGGD